MRRMAAVASNELGIRVNPGQLRTPVQIEKKQQSRPKGQIEPTIQWVSVRDGVTEFYCQWITVHGREVWQSEQLMLREPATVRLRYLPEVTSACRLVRNGIVYEIISVDHVRDRKQWTELKVQRMEAGK